MGNEDLLKGKRKGEDNRFPHPFHDEDGEGLEAYTLIELEIIRTIQRMSCKSNWFVKVKDANIREKWKAELLASGVSEAVAEYALAELTYESSLVGEDGIAKSGVPYVYSSDSLLEESLVEEFATNVKSLETVADHEKDWHPGSNEQILDIVHPSLYCFVAGYSRIISSALPFRPKLAWQKLLNSGEVSKPFEKEKKVGSSFSTTYQWLPSDIQISEDGKSATFESYINNLHPYHHAQLYENIEKVFARFVPMFEKVLSDVLNAPTRRVTDFDPGNLYEEPKDLKADDWEDWFENRLPKLPDVPKFKASKMPEQISLKGRKLQVIVKIGSTELTEEKPKFDGGVWHVEGMENESIVATGIYYYEITPNLSESHLQFRQTCMEPDYEQGDDKGVLALYGLVNEGPLTQSLGSIVAKDGRCIAFPNILQHRVAECHIVDTSSSSSTSPMNKRKKVDELKSASRKILVFFLIDPTKHIISTAVVPPQRLDWLEEELQSRESTLPPEVMDLITKKMEWPMSLEVAKKHREELMKERKFFIKQNTEEYFERPFSLCEH